MEVLVFGVEQNWVGVSRGDDDLLCQWVAFPLGRLYLRSKKSGLGGCSQVTVVS